MQEFLTLLFGALAPIIMRRLKRAHWSEAATVVMTFGLALVFGFLAVLLSGPLASGSMMLSSAAIFTQATIIYKTWLQHPQHSQRPVPGADAPASLGEPPACPALGEQPREGTAPARPTRRAS